MSDSLPLYIIVDDRDVNVTSSEVTKGSLAEGGSTPDYTSTNTEFFASDIGQQSMTLSFYGTGIEVRNTLHGTPLTLNFTLDGVSYPNITQNDTRPPGASMLEPNLFHQGVFSTSNISPSPTLSDDVLHNITLSISASESPSGSMWLDYYVIERPTDAWVEGLKVFYDDDDPRVQYSGTWIQNGTDRAMQGTLHTATESGATATLEFTGSEIHIYGSLPVGASGAVATLSIDGATPTTVNAPTGPFILDGISPNLILFETPVTPGNHTVVLTSLDDILSLDYMLVVGVGYQSGSGSGSGSGGGGATTTGATTGGTAPTSSPGPGSTPPASSSPPPRHTDVAAIAVGAAGGVAGIALVTAIFFFFVLRGRIAKRRKAMYDGGGMGDNEVYGQLPSAYRTPGHEMSNLSYPTTTTPYNPTYGFPGPAPPPPVSFGSSASGSNTPLLPRDQSTTPQTAAMPIGAPRALAPLPARSDDEERPMNEDRDSESRLGGDLFDVYAGGSVLGSEAPPEYAE